MRLSVFGALVIGHDQAIAQGPCKMAHRDGAVLSFGDKDLVAVAIARYQNAIFRRLKGMRLRLVSRGVQSFVLT